MAGKANLDQFLASLPAKLEQAVLRGGIRAVAVVVANEAKDRCISSEVQGAIKVSTRAERGIVSAKVQTKGRGAYLAPWLEYGTDPHFIAVAAADRQGLSVHRINKLAREGSLVINGHFVGPVVHHPGAKAHPFLRPALDAKLSEAVAAMQTYVVTRLAKGDLDTAPPEDPSA